MKSSKKAGGFLSNKPVYALLAIYMPMMILTAFVFFLRELISELTVFNVIYPIVSGGIIAFAATIYCDFMKDIKSSRTLANVRGGIITFIAVYLITSVLYNMGNSFARMFLPNLHNISSCLTALYTWDAVLSMKQLFSARKLFDEYTELYRGEQLQEALFGDTAVLLFNDEEIVRIKNGLMIQLAFVCLIMVLNTALKIPMSLTLYLLMILVFESVVCFLGFLEIFRWEQYYAGEGLALPPFDMIRRMIGIGIFSVLCTIVAIIWSSDNNLINFQLIKDFIKWLLDLLRRNPPPKADFGLENIELLPEPPSFVEPVLELITEVERKPPFDFLKWLQYAFIASVAAGFVWFMISPLFNRIKGSKLTFRQRLGRIIKEWFKGVLDAFSAFIAFLISDKTKQRLHRPNANKIRRTAENVLGAYSHAKKRDMRKSATLFARLIVWGGEVRQIMWKPSHAPGEYCSLLSAAKPSAPSESGVSVAITQNALIDAEIIRCGEIFEKAIYSAEILSNEERKEFKNLVEEIISSPA